MRFKSIFATFILLFISSCKIDDGLDCALVNCADGQLFSIEFLDSEGVNLIANGTYSLEAITLTSNATQLDLIELNANDYVNFILVEKSGETTYTINLTTSEMDSFVLDLSQTSTGGDCCGPNFQINNARYNGDSKEIVQLEYGFEKIVVIK